MATNDRKSLHPADDTVPIHRTYVLTIESGERHIGYLIGFGENHYELMEEHKTWLRQMLNRQQLQAAERIARNENAVCHVWLLGTTSRSASDNYNLALSKLRAKSVENFLRLTIDALQGHDLFVLHPDGLGETVAAVRGHPDDSKIFMDRSVVVAAEWQTLPIPKPPPIKRPEALPKGIWKTFRMRVTKAGGGTHGLPIAKYKGVDWDLEVQDVDKKITARYRFQGHGIELGRSIVSGKRKISPAEPGPWNEFRAAFTMSANDFGGYARVVSTELPEGPKVRDEPKTPTERLAGTDFQFGSRQPLDLFKGEYFEIKDFRTGQIKSSVPGAKVSDVTGNMKLVRPAQ